MIYSIHMIADDRPLLGYSTDESRFDSMVAIPEGLAPWAIIFPPVWLVRYGLILETAIYFCATALIYVLLFSQFRWLAFALSSIPGIYLLLEGHQLRRSKLDAKGFAHVSTVEASCEEEAIEKAILKLNLGETKKVDELSPATKTSPIKMKNNKLAFGIFPETDKS